MKTTKINTNNVVAINAAKTIKPAKPTPAQRFNKLVAEPTADGCELFTGAALQNGYGAFSVDGETIYAHRFAYEMHNNATIPAGKYVLHSLTCTSRLCTAKAHLRIGTAAENSADMVAAGRSVLGRKLPKRVMTTANREQIVSLSLSGLSGYAIAKKTGWSQVVVSYQLRKNKAAVAEKIRARASNILEAASQFKSTLDGILADADPKKAA